MAASSVPWRRRELAWALYDVANSAYATTVMVAFFPVFLKQYWAADIPVTDSTFWLGITNSAAALVALVLSPVLGSLADAGGWKKPLLALFALLGVAMAAALFQVGPGNYPLALVCYGLGMVAFYLGLVFYDALLPSVTEPARLERVSALGYGLGYLGGGVLFAINLAMTLQPAWFGLPDAATAVRWSFLTVAGWWLLFAQPLLWWVPEPPTRRAAGLAAVAAGVRQLRATVLDLRRLKVVMLFLGAYWLYIDAVDTVAQMAVDYALSLGFGAAGLMTALLITQLVGVPATLLYGRLGERFGARPAILAGLAVYGMLVVWGTQMTRPYEFYGIAVGVGLVQGGVQALSRALYARIIPRDKAGEFFGFMNLLSKFAAVLGPALVGLVSRATGAPRLSMLALLILFGAGAALLYRVDVREGERRAAELQG
ncbi:MFS transporter [Candidatus Methylocalor cossyra]|uniref:UMF1 family MFS transporter n=1 Tax=Candidatus Methylocalor cossyra TaxID=3108543 RepID=A0ABP1C9H2_9GAMM